MMRLKVEKIGEGLHPSETVVAIQTKDGPVSLIVDAQVILSDSTVNIGWPVGRENDFYLVELPRETVQGSWRVWVDENELKQTEDRKRA
jgi:hypothetical protein